ncbi:MAG: DUF3482 domain-containing protein [Pseudomonadota bacterium]
MTLPPITIALSLVSHTNVGKTTLARTLLGRDIGEVRDEAHVTELAEAQLLVGSSSGDQLMLWDTPGFGDSLRLARRLAQAGNPIGWFLSEVWDRWRDRPFWSSQRALRNVLDEADVVLYLVNASEAPEDAGYLDAELKVLALIGKPVIALLNQLGPVAAATDTETQQLERWRGRLVAAQGVRAVLALDAFTHCWVQEGALWQAVAGVLPADRQAAFERLREAWCMRQVTTWRMAMAEMARRLARAALDVEAVQAEGWRGPLRKLGQTLSQALGLRGDAGESPQQRAMAALAERLDDDLRQSIDRLIALHGLDGRAGSEVLDKLARHYALRQPFDEGRAALWGGVVSGALAGLKADIASGGLTLGGGLLAGGVLGALAAAGAARGVNLVRGLDRPRVAWDVQVLDTLLASALLGYLAVAHHGRGRGAWVQEAPPLRWTQAVDEVLAVRRAEIAALWARRDEVLASVRGPSHDPAPGANANPNAVLLSGLLVLLESAGADLLARLYPEARAMLPA